METELIIEGSGFPPLSARGCQQTLTVVPQGSFRRTVNGDLHFLGAAPNKYHSVIRCEDKSTLVSEGVLQRGGVVRVGCLQRLWHKVQTDSVCLERPAVEGSLSAVDAQHNTVPTTVINAQTIRVQREGGEQQTGVVYVSYRPWLVMRVLDLHLYTDEWGLKAGWRLTLEEV